MTQWIIRLLCSTFLFSLYIDINDYNHLWAAQNKLTQQKKKTKKSEKTAKKNKNKPKKIANKKNKSPQKLIPLSKAEEQVILERLFLEKNILALQYNGDKASLERQGLAEKDRKIFQDQFNKTNQKLFETRNQYQQLRQSLLAYHEQKKKALEAENLDRETQLSALKKKAGKTPQDFTEMMRLANEISRNSVQINHSTHVLYQIQLRDLYDELISLKDSFRYVTSQILGKERELKSSRDKVRILTLKQELLGAYAQAARYEARQQELETNIRNLSIVRPSQILSAVQQFQETQKQDLQAAITLRKDLSDQKESKLAQIDDLIWQIEQDLKFWENPTYVRLKERPIIQGKTMTDNPVQDPMKPQISLIKILEFYNNQMSPRKLPEFRKEVEFEMKRYEALIRSDISVGKRSEAEAYEAKLGDLLDEIDSKFNEKSRSSRSRHYR